VCSLLRPVRSARLASPLLLETLLLLPLLRGLLPLVTLLREIKPRGRLPAQPRSQPWSWLWCWASCKALQGLLLCWIICTRCSVLLYMLLLQLLQRPMLFGDNAAPPALICFVFLWLLAAVAAVRPLLKCGKIYCCC